MYTLTVSLKNGIVMINFDIDDGKFEAPVLLEDAEKLSFVVCNSLTEARQYVTFYRNRDTNKIEFVNYDRYLYKKV